MWNSPGGAVYESEELHDKLIEYKRRQAVQSGLIWRIMRASGGYMTSVTGDKIYANKNTGYRIYRRHYVRV